MRTNLAAELAGLMGWKPTRVVWNSDNAPNADDWASLTLLSCVDYSDPREELAIDLTPTIYASKLAMVQVSVESTSAERAHDNAAAMSLRVQRRAAQGRLLVQGLCIVGGPTAITDRSYRDPEDQCIVNVALFEIPLRFTIIDVDTQKPVEVQTVTVGGDLDISAAPSGEAVQLEITHG